MNPGPRNISVKLLGIFCFVALAGCAPDMSDVSKLNRQYDHYQQDFVFASDTETPAGSEPIHLRDEDVVRRDPPDPEGEIARMVADDEYPAFFDRDKYANFRNSGMSQSEAIKAATTLP